MAYSDEEQAKLKKQNTQSAIELAMAGRWREAVAANRAIVELFPADVEAMNRLGRAHMELGEYAEAREAYRSTKVLDPYNSIADRNLRRLEVLVAAGPKAAVESGGQRVEPQMFIEETGKAGVLSIGNLGSKEVLARVVAGDKVSLRPAGISLFVDSLSGEYLGSVDARHALRLLKLTKGGNKYSATVISSSEEKLSVIVRETFQDPSQAGQISFPPRPAPAAARKPELETATEELETPAEGEEAEVSPEENLEEDAFPDDEDEEELEV